MSKQDVYEVVSLMLKVFSKKIFFNYSLPYSQIDQKCSLFANKWKKMLFSNILYMLGQGNPNMLFLIMRKSHRKLYETVECILKTCFIFSIPINRCILSFSKLLRVKWYLTYEYWRRNKLLLALNSWHRFCGLKGHNSLTMT